MGRGPDLGAKFGESEHNDRNMRNSLTQHRAQVLRNASTDTERFLWHCLRRRQLLGYRFHRQVPIGEYVADFACVEAKVVVEVDGSQHQEHHRYDLKRDEYLRECGFQVLRSWDNEVLTQTDARCWRRSHVCLRRDAPFLVFPRKRGKEADTHALPRFERPLPNPPPLRKGGSMSHGAS